MVADSELLSAVDADVPWKAAPRTAISRTDRLVPYAAGALPLVVARSRIDDTDDAGVTLGVGHPAVVLAEPSGWDELPGASWLGEH